MRKIQHAVAELYQAFFTHRFCGREKEQRRVVVDATELGTITTNTVLTDKGIQSQRNISVRTNSKGDRLYTGIWSNERAPSELRPAYAGFELVHQPPQEANREPQIEKFQIVK